jgi:hypothetical protein
MDRCILIGALMFGICFTAFGFLFFGYVGAVILGGGMFGSIMSKVI